MKSSQVKNTATAGQKQQENPHFPKTTQQKKNQLTCCHHSKTKIASFFPFVSSIFRIFFYFFSIFQFFFPFFPPANFGKNSPLHIHPIPDPSRPSGPRYEAVRMEVAAKLRVSGSKPSGLARWWFQTFSMFNPKIGEMIHFDEHIFKMGGSTTN